MRRGATLLIVACALIVPVEASAAGPPQVLASWVTDVTASSASLHAQVDPEGLATTYRFEYLSEADYDANLAGGREAFAGATLAPPGGGSLGSGSTPQNVLQLLQHLAPSTAYRYRVFASNSAGPATGATHLLETEETAPVFSLPDGRGWEMVSPADKNGGAVEGPGQNFGGGDLQAAAQGGEVTYSSASSFGSGAQGAPAASQYLAGREVGGWSAVNVSAPQRSGAEPATGSGVPYRVFSEDLSSALLFGGGSCLGVGEGCADPSPPLPGSGAPVGYQDYYLRDDATGAYRALITAADAPSLALSAEAFAISLAGATPNLGQIVLSTCAKLTPEATEVPGCVSGGPNLYRWSGGALALVNPTGLGDARLAAPSGAISTDGSRVYFTATEDGDLYLREGEAARLVSAGGIFQTASADGRIAFFTKAGHLYRYDGPTGTSTDLTPGGEVLGVLGGSADGSRVYYQSATGLYLWEEGAGSTRIAAEADPVDWPPATGEAHVSADGRFLAFASSVEETGFDDTDAGTGLPDAEIYLYDADSGRLTCASCNPTGERPIGSASLPGALANGEGTLATQLYRPRALSADGRRLFFDSEDSLVLQDTNGRPDVYEWEAVGEGSCVKPAGCVSLISSGRDPEASEFIDASADGADVFFLTDASLVPSDPGSYDLYDAREGGGFPIAPTPIPCDGDACQPLPSPPEDPSPGTLVQGPGNPTSKIEEAGSAHKNHHHKRKRHDKKKRRRRHSHQKRGRR